MCADSFLLRMFDYPAARMPYENQRKSIYHSGVSWDAWPQEADQPIAAFADTGFLVPDGGGDLLRQLCTGIAGHPL